MPDLSAIVSSLLPLPVPTERAGTSTPLAVGQLIGSTADLAGLFDGPTETATVTGRSPAGTEIQVNGSRLTLATPIDLPVDSQLTLRLLDRAQNSVAILTLAEPTAPTSSAGAPVAALPTDAISIDATVTATVVATPASRSAEGALPVGVPLAAPPDTAPMPGDRLVFRLLGIDAKPTGALLPAGGAVTTAPMTAAAIAASTEPTGGSTARTVLPLTGTIVGGDAATTTIETPLGTLALSPKLAAETGALVRLARVPDLVARAAPSSTSLPSTSLPPLAEWPALDNALRAVEASSPELVGSLQAALRPTDGARLATSMLTFLAVLRNPSGDPWPTLRATLTKNGRPDLRIALDHDISQLRSLSEDRATGEWQIFALPILDGQTIKPARLMLQRSEDEAGDKKGETGQRFLIDVDMSRLGAVQVDGRVARNRFDVVLRTHDALPDELRADLLSLFDASIAAGGLTGGLSFRVEPRFAVTAVAAAPRPTGITI